MGIRSGQARHPCSRRRIYPGFTAGCHVFGAATAARGPAFSRQLLPEGRAGGWQSRSAPAACPGDGRRGRELAWYRRNPEIRFCPARGLCRARCTAAIPFLCRRLAQACRRDAAGLRLCPGRVGQDLPEPVSPVRRGLHAAKADRAVHGFGRGRLPNLVVCGLPGKRLGRSPDKRCRAAPGRLPTKLSG